MKPSTHAPFFACLYAALCETARSHGYALAIHGTVTTDCDLIAVPWTDTAADAETLMSALLQHIGAVDYRGLLKRDCASWATEKDIDQMVKGEHERIGDPRGPLDCAIKPHGRKAWNLYMEHGCKVDLSVMPRITTDSRESQNAELQRPREAGSVARSGSPAKREARPQQPEVPQSPAERGIDQTVPTEEGGEKL